MIRITGSLLLAVIALAPLTAAAGPAPETAVFAGGCFWSMQHDLESIPGVTSIVVGYTGGKLEHPTYKDVSTEKTGHYEAVQITYDPSKISYAALVERYWHVIDPTDAGGAFCDRGPSYRSAIFVGSPDQRKVAEASKSALAQSKGPIATQVLDAATFWPAEAYHQHYAAENPVHYTSYRKGCGKDARLATVWGSLALH